MSSIPPTINSGNPHSESSTALGHNGTPSIHMISRALQKSSVQIINEALQKPSAKPLSTTTSVTFIGHTVPLIHVAIGNGDPRAVVASNYSQSDKWREKPPTITTRRQLPSHPCSTNQGP